MQSRGRQPNLSFFAFTATPKGKTLELFGRPGANGMPEAFHLYSMRQAIEEGFILDVVKNYTTYATYYRLVKAVEDDPDLPKKKAARALAKFMSLHPHNIEQKTEVIVEHFRQKRDAAVSAAGPRRWSSRRRACTRCATCWRSSATSPRTDTPTSARWSPSAAR